MLIISQELIGYSSFHEEIIHFPDQMTDVYRFNVLEILLILELGIEFIEL